MKYHTILFVPHARARFRKWRVSSRQILVGALTFLLLSATSIFSFWSFLTNTVDLQELDQVRSENEELRRVNQTFETSIRKLQKQLAEFEDQTRQLAIVAGLESLSSSQVVGIGGDDSFGGPTDSAAALGSLQSRADAVGLGLGQVKESLDERQRLISFTPAIAPVRGILTSGFGMRRDPVSGQPAYHPAIDIATAPGQPVRASADGIVVRGGRAGGLGKAVYVSHGYGVTTRYGHLSKIEVVPGQRVKRQDVLGYVGSTGRATGYHLHYEVRVDGKPVNPLSYIVDGGDDGS